MPSPPKPRRPARSVQQIIAENNATIQFYRNMTMTTGAVYNILNFLIYRKMTIVTMIMNLLVSVIYVTCYHLMRYICQPTIAGETIQMVVPGHDVNMSGGMGEFLRDILIISCAAHLMSLFSEKFWLTLFTIPLRGLWLFWVSLLTPRYEYEEVEEVDEEEERILENAENIKEDS